MLETIYGVGFVLMFLYGMWKNFTLDPTQREETVKDDITLSLISSLFIATLWFFVVAVQLWVGSEKLIARLLLLTNKEEEKASENMEKAEGTKDG